MNSTRITTDDELQERQDYEIENWLKQFCFLAGMTKSDLLDDCKEFELMLVDLKFLMVKLHALNFVNHDFDTRVLRVLNK